MSTDWNDLKFINPYYAYLSCFIPNWLLKRKEISFGAKCVYGRLLQYSDGNGDGDGTVCPEMEELANEVGASTEQLDRYLKQLKKNKLIVSRIRKDLDGREEYFFHFHPWSAENIYDVDRTP